MSGKQRRYTESLPVNKTVAQRLPEHPGMILGPQPGGGQVPCDGAHVLVLKIKEISLHGFMIAE